jgi:hypothetical protein
MHNARLVPIYPQAEIPFELPFYPSLNAGIDVTGHHHEVSSPGESHPQALLEPDVNLSAHPAPIIQPQAKSPSASEQRAEGHALRFSPTSALPCADGDSASCISFEPIVSAPDSYAA